MEDFWASLRGFLLLAVVVLFAWCLNFLAMPYFFPGNENTTGNAGTAGDMFGALTALFSGLAFAGLVTTLFMQRKELELQRRELSQTRDVFSIQRFENTFFGMLRLLIDYINSLKFEGRVSSYTLGDSKEIFGRDVLEHYSDSLPKPYIENNISGINSKPEYRKDPQDFTEMMSKYDSAYTKYRERDLGPYFRLIYNILRLIEHSVFHSDANENEKAKLMYSKILRAHLSSSEVRLLMFNCASVHGSGLKKWIEKHSMLKHITREDYELYCDIVNKYDESAFKFDERRAGINTED